MPLSELIARLTALHRDCGDLPVIAYVNDARDPVFRVGDIEAIEALSDRTGDGDEIALHITLP